MVKQPMFRKFSIVYACFFLAVGILGFIPFLAPENHLFMILKVNVATNIIHILTGLAALGVVFVRGFFERLYFQIIGFIYAILALFGFIYGSRPLLGFIANNCIWTWIHLAAALGALILGFATPSGLEKKGKR